MAYPEQIVQQLVDAYNARDLEAFVAIYAPEIEIRRLPSDEVLMQGHADLRDRYGRLFESSPDLHAEIVERIALGHFVIDKERVQGIIGQEMVEAIAIYEVRDDLIRRVWFIGAN